MSVARFIADQRTNYRVSVAVCCAILGLSVGWFYKWIKTSVTGQQRRRRELDVKVAELFAASGQSYGSPRIHRDLLDAGWRVGENTVAESMRRQGFFGRKPKRRRGLTKQDKTAPVFPDLLRRDFSAAAPNRKWCGDIIEIPTGEGKLYLATVLDLYSRRLLACPMSEHPDRWLAIAAIKIAAASRGGRDQIEVVIFHTDRGSTYTASDFTAVSGRLGIRQSMGRVGSCFDNAAAESFCSTLEYEVLSRHRFATKAEARQGVLAWCHDFYNTRRRHSSAALLAPAEFEKITADQPAAA